MSEETVVVEVTDGEGTDPNFPAFAVLLLGGVSMAFAELSGFVEFGNLLVYIGMACIFMSGFAAGTGSTLHDLRERGRR